MVERRLPLLILICLGCELISLSIPEAAPDAFIPPKYKGTVLYTPVPDFPRQAANRFGYGSQGIYRLKFNQQTGTVTDVSVLKAAPLAKLNALMVFELMKWKAKPATITQFDVPIVFENPIRVELKEAVSK